MVIFLFSINNMDDSDSLVVQGPLRTGTIMSPPKNLSLILSVCGEALKTYGDKKISVSTILILLQHIILSVKKLTKLNEEEKKQLVLDSIHWLIEHQQHLSVEDKQTLELLSDSIFPQVITLLTENNKSSCCF
jgi:hypothetical protein